LNIHPDETIICFAHLIWKLMQSMAKNLDKWLEAQKKFKLSDKHIQMARELGLNPAKFGKLNNHKQERWKAPFNSSLGWHGNFLLSLKILF